MQTKFKIIETPEYLLAVSDKEIKELDTVYNQIPNSIKKVKSKEELNLVKTINERANEIQKIIAYQPKGNAPELDLPLLPEMFVENNVKKLAENYTSNETDKTLKLISKYSFRDGHKAATKVYTEEDLRNAINMGIDLWMNSMTDNSAELTESDYQQIIQSLKQSKTTPKWFVAEMEEVAKPMPWIHIKTWELKTTTNSEGKQVLVGTYLFE
jgi:hypothetical protein